MKTRVLIVLIAALAVSFAAVAGSSRFIPPGYKLPGLIDHGDDSSDSSSGKSDSDSDSSSGDRATACARSAQRMLRSCRFEVSEELHATVASCLNFADADERGDCREEAQEARVEDGEGCHDQVEARLDVCDLLDEDHYDPDPLTDESIHFIDPDDIGDTEPENPYFSLKSGRTHVLRAGEDFEETIVVTVTDEVQEIQGVDCRVVVDIVLLWEDDEYVAVEVTDDFYAQSDDGDIYYCGEVARNFEDGLLVDLDGSFQAGRDFAKAGILIKASPSGGDAHRQEYLLGEAEDVIRYVGTSESPSDEEGGDHPDPLFACAVNGGCVKTEEFIPPEPDSGEFKYFMADTGFVLGVALENGVPTGERDELVCIGDSLDILGDDKCGLDNSEELREMLCRLSPDAFCEDDD